MNETSMFTPQTISTSLGGNHRVISSNIEIGSSDELLNDMFNACLNNHICLVASGGVGKSWSIKRLANKLRSQKFNVYVTATTGVAAVNLNDPELDISARTLHSFAGIQTGQGSTEVLIKKASIKAKRRWNKCDYLIIDEISMLGGNLFSKICAVARALRKNQTFPMGGIKLILSGDFLQLQPVNDCWIFQTMEWESLNLKSYVLNKPYRYTDMRFFDLLMRVREGKPTKEDWQILRARVQANKELNEILKDAANTQRPEYIIKPTMFFSRKLDVESFNERELEKLEGKEYTFEAQDIFEPKKDGVKYEEYEKLLDEIIPRTLTFKIGAQVMLKVNLNVDAGLVNGSRGVVFDIIPGEAMIVNFLNKTKVRIDLHATEIDNKKARCVRTQIPFVLAYAMTIHKSQSCTLDFIQVSLDSKIFAPGQAYVALSRCRDINGLFITELCDRSIMVDKEALAYCEKLKNSV